MKRLLIILLFVAAAFGMFLVIGFYFPKSVGRYPFFVVLLLADLYLYFSYHKKIWSFSKVKASLITLAYWYPLIGVAAIIAGSMYTPFDHWNNGFKNYLTGFILIGYAAKLIPIVFLLIADAIRLFQKIISKRPSKQTESQPTISRSTFLKRVGLAGGGLVFGGLLLGMIKWIYDFKVWKEFVKLPHLPQSFEGFKIVQFSDIHLGNWNSKKELENAVQLMNDQNPDVIFFTGDLVNYATSEALEFETILARLKANYGIYSVLGNHDYGDYKRWESQSAKDQNMKDIFGLYERLGWNLLRNQNDIIKKGDQEIAIVGVENWGSLGRFQKYGDLDKAIQGAEHSPVKLLLSHDPSHWELIVSEYETSVDLTFSGHTHGAQFGIEIPGIRWSPAQYIYKYWAGLYSLVNPNTNMKQYLYVNRGIGTIGYPGRVGILPEITSIELQA